MRAVAEGLLFVLFTLFMMSRGKGTRQFVGA